MAKLTGVKTIDMVNGEITKVEYNGEHYVKVEGSAEHGDLGLRIKDNCSYAKVGEFYPITEGKRFLDDDGYNPYFGEGKFIFFRKQSAPTLTDRVASLEQRVDSLEGKAQETYRLVTDRKPKVGDFVKINRTSGDNYDDVITKGKYYEIMRVDACDDPHIIDDDGDEYDTVGDEFEVYEKVSATQPETITHNGAAYTLVDRKAQPGDVVVFTESDSPYVTNGKTYGPVTEEDGDLYVADDYDGDPVRIYNAYFNRTPANVKVYAQVAKQVEPLKVGEFFKTLTTSRYGKVKKGVIGEIVRDHHDGDYTIQSVSGGQRGIFDASQLVRATDEEVAQAKAQQAELARWAAIGRKPNEYKKGDIVRVQKGNVWFNNEDEIYGEVMNSNHQTQIKARYTDGRVIPLWISNNSVELITPVEARFDVTDRA